MQNDHIMNRYRFRKENMKNKPVRLLCSLLWIASLVLGACEAAPTAVTNSQYNTEMFAPATGAIVPLGVEITLSALGRDPAYAGTVAASYVFLANGANVATASLPHS